MNKTKALDYFLEAAALEMDGDSLFNAGHMYYEGLGTDKNRTMSFIFFDKAASKFGHL